MVAASALLAPTQPTRSPKRRRPEVRPFSTRGASAELATRLVLGLATPDPQVLGARCSGCRPELTGQRELAGLTGRPDPRGRPDRRPAGGRGFSRISPGLWYPGGHSSGLSDSRFLRITALSGERERTGCFRTRDSWEFGV